MKALSLIVLLLCAVHGAIPVSPPKMTPSAAVKVLQNSNDLEEITSAVIVAVASPEGRRDVITFFDGPSRRDQINSAFENAHNPAPTSIRNDRVQLEQWGKSHPDEIEKFDNERIWLYSNSSQKISEFLAQSNDPAMFEIFKHFAESKAMGNLWSPVIATEYFVLAIPRGSPLTPLVLDYADKKARMEKTGEASDDLGARWLNAMLLINTDDAFARIYQGIATDKYLDSDIKQFRSTSLYWKRYEPAILSIYEICIEKMPNDKKEGPLSSLFDQQDMSDPPNPRLPYLDKADPSVYPRLLKIILNASKIKLSAQTAGILANAKRVILDLYAKHGMTPPTNAELDALPSVSAPPLPTPADNKSTAQPLAASATKHATQATSAPDTTPSTSWPLYALLGAAVLGGLFLLLRKR